MIRYTVIGLRIKYILDFDWRESILNENREKYNIFLVMNKNLYFYNLEPRCVCPVKSGYFWRIVRKLCRKFSIVYPKKAMNEYIKKANKVVFSDLAFGGDILLLKSIERIVGQENIILYYMNIIDNANRNYMDSFKNIYTFNKKDAEKYALNYSIFPFTTRYSCNIKQIKNYEYDAIFLGHAKGREKEILSIKENMEQAGLTVLFMVMDAKNPEICLDHYMDYQKYIELVKKTKCLVEILQEGQEGSSLRVKEAIFMKKKFITNNTALVNEWFYDRNNMYILNNDVRDMVSFIKSEYLESGMNLDILDFSYWINHF